MLSYKSQGLGNTIAAQFVSQFCNYQDEGKRVYFMIDSFRHQIQIREIGSEMLLGSVGISIWNMDIETVGAYDFSIICDVMPERLIELSEQIDF